METHRKSTLLVPKKIFKMIESLIKKEPTPKKQEGKVSYFERRHPDQSEIKDLKILVIFMIS